MTIGDDAIMARETFASFVRVAERLARLYVVPYALFLQRSKSDLRVVTLKGDSGAHKNFEFREAAFHFPVPH